MKLYMIHDWFIANKIVFYSFQLLAPDIRHERNVVLQCIRYIIHKDFFGLACNDSNLVMPDDTSVTVNGSVSGNDVGESKLTTWFSWSIQLWWSVTWSASHKKRILPLCHRIYCAVKGITHEMEIIACSWKEFCILLVCQDAAYT